MISTSSPPLHRCSLVSSLSSNHLPSSLPTSISALRFRRSSFRPPVLRRRMICGKASAITSVRPVVGRSGTPIRLTYLEANSWLWEFEGVIILVDPILVGNLDFGVPWLYDGAKRFVKNYQLNDLPDIDCVLITQGLDDHCHARTLTALSKLRPNVKVVAAPNAKPILNSLFSNITYLTPGQKSDIKGKNGLELCIRATAGPVLGPPWQDPENGYLISFRENHISLYYEPHCVCDLSLLETQQADIVITPVIKQMLPSFTLVSGQEDAVELLKTLQAKFVVPMNNGNLDAKGILSSILRKVGTIDSFKQLLSRELPGVQVLEPVAGVPLDIPVESIIS